MPKIVSSDFPSLGTRGGGAPVILQILPRLGTGGVERGTVDLAEELVKLGWRALVVAERGELVERLHAVGGEFIEMPAATKNPLKMWANRNRLIQIIKNNNVDIVHARSRAPAWSALWATSVTKTPFVTTYHGNYTQRSAIKGFYNSVMARGDVVIAGSNYIADLVKKRHPANAGSVKIVPRGVDLEAFSIENVHRERIEDLRDKWDAFGDRPILMLPGRMSPNKGHILLIEAVSLLLGRNKKIELDVLLVGPGRHQNYMQLVEQTIELRGLGLDVRYVGNCDDMPAAMAMADFAVLPSWFPETFGRVSAEAQAMGTPVIVADCGAFPETLISDEIKKTGWIVQKEDPEIWADAIEQALALSQSERIKMSQAAIAHVNDRFSLAGMMEKKLDIYISLLKPR